MTFFNWVLSFALLFSYSFAANGESTTGETFTVSSFSYPETRLRPFDLRYIRGLWPNLQWPFFILFIIIKNMICFFHLLAVVVLKHYLVWSLVGWNWILMYCLPLILLGLLSVLGLHNWTIVLVIIICLWFGLDFWNCYVNYYSDRNFRDR